MKLIGNDFLTKLKLNFFMENIIITGTDGFIGGSLYKTLENNFNIYTINEDVFNSNDWTDTLYKILTEVSPTTIYHIGACANTLETDVNYMMTRNYEFTKIVSDYSKSNNVKLIYSSSAANYGVNGLYPSNLYGWSKYVAEDYVLKNGGIALRYFNVYGPGESHKGTMASVAYQMLVKKSQNKKIELFPLNPRRDFVYIDDVISANIFANDNYSKLVGSYYEVGSGEARSFEDVMDILGLEYSYLPEELIPKGYQFITKSNHLKWMPNWLPKIKIDDGLVSYLKELKKEW